MYHGTSYPPHTRTERHSAARTVLIGLLSTSQKVLSCFQFRARGMEYWPFYECLGKMLLSTEAEGAKAQAELVLELQLGLRKRHIEFQKYRDAEDRNRTREQGYCSNQFFSLVSRDFARALAPTPALKTTRRYRSTRFPGIPPIPSTQLPIQTGVSAPTAAGGMVLGLNAGP